MIKQVKIRVLYDFNPKCKCGKDHYLVEVRVFYFFTATVCHDGTRRPIYFEHPNDALAFKDEFYQVSEYMKQQILSFIIIIIAIALAICFIVRRL